MNDFVKSLMYSRIIRSNIKRWDVNHPVNLAFGRHLSGRTVRQILKEYDNYSIQSRDFGSMAVC